jgi:hypothetical protein
MLKGKKSLLFFPSFSDSCLQNVSLITKKKKPKLHVYVETNLRDVELKGGKGLFIAEILRDCELLERAIV